jgi:carboxymethylenebutenolidase
MEIHVEGVRVETPDGAMRAHLGTPEGPGPFPAVIVAMEAFGLNRHIEIVAERLAREGYVAIAPDFYHRAEESVAPYSDLPKAIGLMSALTDDQILDDVRATLAFLRARPTVRDGRIGMTGFCMGGRITFLTACELEIQAAAPFYGGGIGRMLDRADGLSCPVVAFFGEKDGFIPLSEVDAVKRRLADLGKDAEVVVYEGADHGFFCDERPSYAAEAATDAWTRLLALFDEHLRA